MSMTTVQVETKAPAAPQSVSRVSRVAVWISHARDLVDLAKPRITAMVLVAVVLSYFVASLGQPDLVVLFHILLGTTLVAASSGAWNQWLEMAVDARMERTANRPLPTGRMSIGEVVSFGAMSLLAGMTYLVVTVGWHPAIWALTTWVVYVCIYTPMKTRSHWNTAVGAVSGALPLLIGWSATGRSLDWNVGGMLLLLFVWQFPHFLAIAWMYRRQYQRAGLQMLTTTDPSGKAAGVVSVVGAYLVWGCSLLPLVSAQSGVWTVGVYTLLITALGWYQLQAARRFQRNQTDDSARQLLMASVVYLPLALGLIAVQTVL